MAFPSLILLLTLCLGQVHSQVRIQHYLALLCTYMFVYSDMQSKKCLVIMSER